MEQWYDEFVMKRLALFAVSMGLFASAQADYFRVNLTFSPGAEIQTPPVISNAYAGGAIEVRTDSQGNAFIRYNVQGKGLNTAITSFTLHVGAINENGPLVAELINSSTRIVRGTKGSFSMQGSVYLPFAQAMPFLAQLSGANVYLNIRTAQYPDGELRTQIG